MKLATRLVLLAVFAIPVCTHADELESAVKRGKPDRIRNAIAAGGDINKRYSRNQTVLHIAAERGNLPAVQVLVESGANMNAQDSNGDTPLHVAVANERFSVVKYLLSRGADYRIRNSSNRDVTTHAAVLASQQGGGGTSGNSDLPKIADYLAATIPALPPPSSTGVAASASGSTEAGKFGEPDTDDTITIDLAKYKLTPENLRTAAKRALNTGVWSHLASEDNREIGSYFLRNRDREYRAEIRFVGNLAKISYLQKYDSRHDKPLRIIARNFERELKRLDSSALTHR